MRRKQITVTNNLVSNNVGNIAVEWKGMKKRLLHFKKKFVPVLSGAVMGVMLMSTTCFAAGFIWCEMQIDTILWGGYNKKNCASRRKYIF